jgi:hypothetical protein
MSENRSFLRCLLRRASVFLALGLSGSMQNVSLYVNGVQLAHRERQVFTEAYL